MIESAFMGATKSVPKDVVARFTGIEISRFTTRVERAQQGIRGYHLEDCQKYLGIWRSIQAKDYDWDKLTEEERAEVLDAMDDDEHG